MTRQLVFVIPCDQVDRVRANLDQMWGYLTEMHKDGQIPDHHAPPLLEYLANARAGLRHLESESRELPCCDEGLVDVAVAESKARCER